MARTKSMSLLLVLPVFACFGQDAVKLAPGMAKVEFENAQVKVVRFKLPPGSDLPMHSHPAYVSVELTGGHGRFTFPDGKTREERTRPGSVNFSNAVTHAARNLGGNAMEVVVIELKTRPAGARPAGAADAAKADPVHVKVELENDFVRVLRAKVGPREHVPMHAHPPHVNVFLTGGHLRSTYDDGRTEEVRPVAGQLQAAPAMKHAIQNLSDAPVELVSVELKTAEK